MADEIQQEPQEAPAPLVKSRHSAREAALQAVFAFLSGGQTPDEAWEAAAAEWRLHPSSSAFAERLATTACGGQKKWEASFAPFLSESWPMDRLALIDRACLMLACVELWDEPGIPPKSTITEWVRLGKKYGGRDSHRFINGVLASVLPNSPKFRWDPSSEEKPDRDEEAPAADEIEIEEHEVQEGDPELEAAKRAGAWVIGGGKLP